MEKIKEIYNSYLILAKEKYGTLPQQLYKTTILLEVAPNDASSSAAYFKNNVCYINPKSVDIEWTIFHELEHIRLIHSQDSLSGVLGFREDKGGYLAGVALNEALTNISVKDLLKRETKLVGYSETVILGKQIGTLLGYNDKEILAFYTKKGRQSIKKEFAKLTGKENSYESLEQVFDLLHIVHLQDLEYEFAEHEKILNSPLGSNPSSYTISLRKLFYHGLVNRLKQGVHNNSITKQEFAERLEKINELSPYKNTEYTISNKDAKTL